MPSTALSANHYIRAGATGSAPCSDWTSANACNDLPASLVRGDLYYIAGGTYGEHVFNDADSGTTTIEVRAATVADHGTSTGWLDSYASQAVFQNPGDINPVLKFNTDYYILNGVYRDTGWRSGYGIKLDNHLCTGGCDSAIKIGLQAQNSTNHITVKYVEVQGSKDLADPMTRLDDGFRVLGISNNIYLGYCYIHDVSTGWVTIDATDTATVEYCWFQNGHSTATQHAEGFALRACGAGACGVNAVDTNITIRYNYWENADGTGYLGTPNNLGKTVGPACSNWYIYGNVMFFNSAESNGQKSAAGIQIWNCHWTGDFFILNNTLYAMDRGPSNSGSCNIFGMDSNTLIDTFTVQNNLWYNCIGPTGPPGLPGGIITTLVWSYNAYFDANPSDSDANKQVVTGTNPFVDVSQVAGHVNFRLTAANNAGVTFASPYNTDIDGHTRGADGVWDRGAYEFGPAASTTISTDQGGSIMFLRLWEIVIGFLGSILEMALGILCAGLLFVALERLWMRYAPSSWNVYRSPVTRHLTERLGTGRWLRRRTKIDA